MKSQLPPVPSDIQLCFRKGPVFVPDRALNVYDVESLWKSDRVRIVIMKRCGVRFVEWYESLRVSWN